MTINHYSIQELLQSTGLPRRTIHFYTQQGLLPPPTGAGLGARYGEEHLLRLKLIPVLRDQGLRLDEIRRQFEGMGLDALRALAAQSTGAPSAPNGSPPASGLRPTSVNLYALPGGVTISAPAALKPSERKKLLELIQAARSIYDLPDDGQEKA